MKLLSLTICEDIIRDISTDSVSLINIMESIKATSFPVSLHKVAIYAIFLKDSENIDEVFTGNLKLYNNDALIATSALNFSVPKMRVRMMSRFQGLLLTQAGTFEVRIEVSGKLNQSFTIPVIKIGTSLINIKD